jgi:hypothetical protein
VGADRPARRLSAGLVLHDLGSAAVTSEEAWMDRYTKAVLTVIAVTLVVLAFRPWLPAPGGFDSLRPDAAQAQTAAAKYEVTIPKAWGKYVAYSNNNLLLEAADQTMRIVDVEGKAPEYPRVKVLIRWQ